MSEASSQAGSIPRKRIRRRLPERRSRSSGNAPAVATAGDKPDENTLQSLIIVGWLTALLYFPSGLLHGVLGPVVYVRDVMLGLHLIASILWLARKDQIAWVARHNWIILITPVLLVPAVLERNYTMEALRTCKWSMCWLDWIVLGHLVRLNKRWGDWWKILGGITLAMMAVELVAGAIEWHTGSYLFPTTWGETTAFGVMRGNDQVLEGKLRIHGLQRDVFSFANIMAMNAVGAMAYLTIARKPAHQIGAAAWAMATGGMLLISGGRSALFGVSAALIYMIWLLTARASARKYARWYVLAWLIFALVLSYVGVGNFTDFIGGKIMGGAYVGDSQSAYMRDDYWVKMRGDFANDPLILVIGGPLTSLLDSRVAVMFHWADNQILWNTYHLGVAGSLAMMFFFYKVIEPDPRDGDRLVRQVLILFLVFVLGEGIARESMTFMGCLPLFLLCGYDSACQMQARRSSTPVSALRLVRHHGAGGSK